MARPRRRSPFVVTIASVATVVACGGSTNSDLSSGGAGGTGGKGGAGGTSGTSGTGGSAGAGGSGAGCPASFPQHGTSCTLPPTTICTYSQGQCCPPWQATCIDGQWQAYASSCNPPPPDPCPAEPPPDGAPCGSRDPCGNPYQYCTYGGICADGADATVAQCTGGTWQVTNNCTPSCEELPICECHARSDCQIVSDSCICICDYSCPGIPPCDCSCGGGNYLGCKPVGG